MKLTKEHIEQTIAYLQEQLKLIEPKIQEQLELVEPQPKTIYDLKFGDEFYCLDEQDKIQAVVWYNTKFNLNQRRWGNCFLTIQEAQDHIDYIIAKAEYLEFIREWNGDKVIDWSDGEQRKYRLYFDGIKSKLEMDYWYHNQHLPDEWYFVSFQQINDNLISALTDKLGKDKVILAITGRKL